MKKRVIGSLLAAVLVLGSITGCGGGATEEGGEASTDASAESSGEKVSITFSSFFVEGEFWEVVTADAVEKFNADHDGEAEIIMDAMPHDAYLTQMNAKGIADDVAEMAMVNGSMMTSFSDIGAIVPMDELIDEYGLRDVFRAGMVEEGMNIADGNIYSVPTEAGLYSIIMYNTAIFEEVGIKEFPKTMDEMYEVSAKLQEAGYIPMMLGDVALWPADSCTMSGIVNNYVGNDWYQSIRKNDGEANFTDQEFIDALNAFLAYEPYFNEDYASLAQIDRLPFYANGDAAMLSSGLWECGKIEALNADTAAVTKAAVWPAPATGAKVDGSAVNSAAWGIALGSKITDEQKAYVGEFLKDYFYTEEHGQYLTEECDTLAAWNYEYDESKLSVPGVSMIQVAGESTACANWDATLQPTIKEIYQRGLQELLIGAVTAEDLAAQMQAELEALR